ncbi:DUF1294 domain-containing protein [Shewanella sp. 10N.286.51.B8]
MTLMKIFALISLCLMALFSYSIWPFLAIYVAATNLLSFLITWLDKRAAANQTWRTQERTLHLFALLGGWPAGLLAQQTFRHKTQKTPFKWIYLCSILVNILAFSGLAYLQYQGF